MATPTRLARRSTTGLIGAPRQAVQAELVQDGVPQNAITIQASATRICWCQRGQTCVSRRTAASRSSSADRRQTRLAASTGSCSEWWRRYSEAFVALDLTDFVMTGGEPWRVERRRGLVVCRRGRVVPCMDQGPEQKVVAALIRMQASTNEARKALCMSPVREAEQFAVDDAVEPICWCNSAY